jgi:hypothetical protein
MFRRRCQWKLLGMIHFEKAGVRKRHDFGVRRGASGYGVCLRMNFAAGIQKQKHGNGDQYKSKN